MDIQNAPYRVRSLHSNIAAYGDTFHSRGNKAFIVSTESNERWINLCDILEISELVKDERYPTNSLRLTHRLELSALLANAFKRFEPTALPDVCLQNEVPFAPIRDMQKVFDIPVAQNLMLEEHHKNSSISKRIRTVVFKIANITV